MKSNRKERKWAYCSLITARPEAQQACAYEADSIWDPDIARAEPDGDNGGSIGCTTILASMSNPFSSHLVSISQVPEPQDIKCTFLPPCFCSYCSVYKKALAGLTLFQGPLFNQVLQSTASLCQALCKELNMQKNKTRGARRVSNAAQKRREASYPFSLDCGCAEVQSTWWNVRGPESLHGSMQVILMAKSTSIQFYTRKAVIFKQAMLSNNCLLKSSS